MKRITTLLLFISLIVLSNCTSIIEGSLREGLVGSWEAFEMYDVMDQDTIIDPFFGFTAILDDHGCDSFTLEEDDSFFTYYQKGGSTTGSNAGNWEYAFTNLTFTFDDGEEIVRQITLNGDVLMLDDTIAGRPKIVTYLKVD